jgi:thioredoxin 1
MIKVIRFTSTKCEPCKTLAPIFDQLKVQYTGRAQFQSVDVDFNKEFANQKSINSVPTIIIERNGIEVNRIVGVRPKATYEALINAIH